MERSFNREYQYYKILGLNKDASIVDIKRAYRLIMGKYHPDKNKDPKAEEIAKKINEAHGVLSDPGKRLIYDNSEAECPKCWTHEVKRNSGKDWTAPGWTCTHCGCNFTYVTKKREKEDSERTDTEHEHFVCPRCGKPLVLDDFLKLYRCNNKTCKGVFSRFELKKYYGGGSKKRRSAKSSIGENKGSTIKETKNQQSGKERVKQVVISANEKLALKFICGISILLTAILLYFLLFSFSLLILGLFMFVFGFSILSWYIYRYPNTISTIKSLISMK